MPLDVVATSTGDPTDEALAVRATQGDRGAFATLYERHFSAIYDFAMRIVRDRDTAADVVQSAFASAWVQFQEGKRPERTRAWLYAIARNQAIDELRRRRREVTAGGGEGEDTSFVPIDASTQSNPQAAAQDRELVDLVWGAAAALNPSDYALLDMHVRRGLGADEMATALGTTKGNIYTKLSRLRASLEEAVTATILMRRARDRCDDLDALLTDRQASELNREVRAAIQHHLERCPRCQESKRRFVSPAEIFAGLALVGAAPGLRAAIWQRTASEMGAAASGGSSVGPSGIAGRPGHWLAHASTASKVAVAAVAASIVAGITTSLVVALSGGGNAPVERPFEGQPANLAAVAAFVAGGATEPQDNATSDAAGQIAGIGGGEDGSEAPLSVGAVPNDPGLAHPEPAGPAANTPGPVEADPPATDPGGTGPPDDSTTGPTTTDDGGTEPPPAGPDGGEGGTPDEDPGNTETAPPDPDGDGTPAPDDDGAAPPEPDPGSPGTSPPTPAGGAPGPPPADPPDEDPGEPDPSPPDDGSGGGQTPPGPAGSDCSGAGSGSPPADAAGDHPAPDAAPPQCSDPWPPGTDRPSDEDADGPPESPPDHGNGRASDQGPSDPSTSPPTPPGRAGPAGDHPAPPEPSGSHTPT